MSEPVRTCVGCRTRAPAAELTRYVAAPAADDDGDRRVVVRASGSGVDGRGAWLHPDPACAELARKRGAFRRALRVSGPLDDSLE